MAIDLTMPLSAHREKLFSPRLAMPEQRDAESKNPETTTEMLKEFIGKTLVKYTTGSSAAINAISTPIRLFDDGNPLKKIINNISMFFTKFHLVAYAAAGLISAMEQKNPMLVFSFATEGVAAFLGLRSIYLFRGIATGIDGAAAGIKDKHKKSHFNSYYEGYKHFINSVKGSFDEFVVKFAKDPLHIFKLSGPDIAIFASLVASLGGIFGMTVNEKIGGTIRDVAGGIGDIGIFRLNNPIAKGSGLAYVTGTILDLAARVFNKGIANLLNVKNVNAFEKLRDAFHEAAIAFDRIGQFLFLRYNQQDEESLKTKTRDDDSEYLMIPKSFIRNFNKSERKSQLHSAAQSNTAMAA